MPIFFALESLSFRKHFGTIAGFFPKQSLPLNDTYPLGPLLVQAPDTTDPPADELKIRDLNGQYRRFIAETFFNQHCYFAVFAPAKRLRLGRQIKVAG